MSKHIKYDLQVIAPSTASERIRAIYAQIKHDLMQVPEPFSIHSPAPEILAGVWGIFRESLVAGHVDRGLKEVIAATIAKINRCPWCVDAHSIALYATGRSNAVKALAAHDSALDPVTEKTIAWALATRTPGSAILLNPPFSPQDLPEIVGTAITFHYLTKMVNALLDETFLPSQDWLHTPLKRALGVLFASRTKRATAVGETSHFLPDAALPADFAWALSSPAVAEAFAKIAHVMDDIDTAILPPEVRALVNEHITAWSGEDPGLSRRWVDEAVGKLPSDFQPIAKLVLLAALAPHQIDERLINAYRSLDSDDGNLIRVLSYGSFIASRRIGTWLVPALTPVFSSDPL
jgi:AhpD family alkylhydroperoxidase